MGYWSIPFGAAGAVLLFGWTNPAYTQRKFSPLGAQEKRLELRTRESNVTQLQQFRSPDHPMDVLVVGGGSVGTGAALDARMRGLQVGLVEMQDYGSGTSSRSTKLIHGGIRYLEKAVMKLSVSQMKLVAEALRERGIMIHQAPHLCEPLPTMIPCYHVFDLMRFYAGLKLYDIIAAFTGGTLKYSGILMPYQALRTHPTLRTTSPTNSALVGAVQYYDGQMNDSRLCFSVAMTASALGAAVTNYTEVKSIDVVQNTKAEDVVKTTVADKISGEVYTLYSRTLINAGGPFTRKVEELDKAAQSGTVSPRTKMVPSIGTHIVVDRQYCPRDHTAMVVPSSDGRIVFTIPWQGGCLMGTTDRPCEVCTDPEATQKEVSFLLDQAKPYVGTIPESAVKSVWAGIRPLAAPEGNANSSDTQNIVREHLIQVEPSRRMVSISGGKWTTYRRIAEEAVTATAQTFFEGTRASLKQCNTENVVLLGARELQKVPSTPPKDSPLPPDIHQHWRSTYGDRYPDLLKLLRETTGTTPMEVRRLAGRQCPVTELEVIWATRNEHCEHVTDFLARRTRMAFVDVHMATQSIEKVAELMAREKKWSSSQKKTEINLARQSMQYFTAKK